MSTKYVEVEVDIDAADLDTDELLEEIQRRMLPLERGLGDGDLAYTRSIIARAEAAARRLPYLPPELRDLFWHVHGVAIA
jgi:hypothetical protein